MGSPKDGTPPQSEDQWRSSNRRQSEPLLSEDLWNGKGKKERWHRRELNPEPLAKAASALPLISHDTHQHPSVNNVVEAHCYTLQYRWIDCEQVRSRINQKLISGLFRHEGLRQLRTKLKDSVAMSLYDIIHCSEQAKPRTAYKLKKYRVRLGKYSNQICFQCTSQATTC